MPSFGARRADDPQCRRRWCRITSFHFGRAHQRVAVEHKRQGRGRQGIGPIRELEVQVRLRGVAAVPKQAEPLPDCHALAHLNGNAARLQVRVHRPHVTPDVNHHVVPR